MISKVGLITRQLLIVVLMGTLLGACAAVKGPSPNDPFYAPNYPTPPKPDFENPGGIQYARFGNSLFSDRKARHVGDILTVILSERTASTKSADTDITKDDSIQFNDGVVFGKNVNQGSYDLSADVTQVREFESEAASQQSNSLSGNITVTVIDVLPNGLLVLRGEKWLRLNQGDEYIRLTGLAREEDVSSENSITSTQLADARISYSGTGALANSNTQGWISRFFNGPLWPF